MAEHFLTKTQIKLNQCLRFGDELAIEAFEALQAALKASGGNEAAAAFAEPLLSRGNDRVAPSVSWYTDVQGNATPFGRLDAVAQMALSAELSRRLGPVRAGLANGDTGGLLGCALHIPDLNDVWSVEGTPVIINWGMMPAGAAQDASARKVHYAQTMGRFLPLAGAPPVSAEEIGAFAVQPPAAAPSASPAGTAATVAATATSPPQQMETPPPAAATRQRVPLWAWLPLPVLLVLAGVVLIWLLSACQKM